MKGSTRSKLIKLLKELERREKEKKPKIRHALLKKQAIVEEIKKLFSQYGVVAIIDLFKVPTPQFKRLRKELEKYGFIKVYKNSLFLRAMKDLNLKGIDELSTYLTGTNAFLFTNMNPFELALIIDKLSDMRYAKPGDVATDDIYLPQGPTGIPPGPMLSVFGKLRVPTQVREGNIWIAKEVRVAKKGDVISPELASLLRKLGIKVIEVKLKIKAVWDHGLVIPSEKLKLDLSEYRSELEKALSTARCLAVELALPIPEVMPQIIAKAVRTAMVLTSESAFITPTTAELVVRSAISKALVLAQVLMSKEPKLELGVAVPTAPQPQPPKEEEKKEEKEEKEEKKEEVSEEEIAEGIASLFG